MIKYGVHKTPKTVSSVIICNAADDQAIFHIKTISCIVGSDRITDNVFAVWGVEALRKTMLFISICDAIIDGYISTTTVCNIYTITVVFIGYAVGYVDIVRSFCFYTIPKNCYWLHNSE